MFVCPLFCREATLTVPRRCELDTINSATTERRTSLSDADRVWHSRTGLIDLAPVGLDQLLQFALRFLFRDAGISHDD